MEAENGRAALDAMSGRTPGLILLDLMMPEMDGFEFLTELHKNPDWWKIPVIVVTAKDLTPEDKEYLEGRVLKILQKGAYTTDELLEEVLKFVGQHATPVKG
jgi:CheY-like chemotaxis protein